jgi:hypothetical protein
MDRRVHTIRGDNREHSHYCPMIVCLPYVTWPTRMSKEFYQVGGFHGHTKSWQVGRVRVHADFANSSVGT